MEITLVKPARGGFGFTVAGGANSGGCYIKDILHDPALSDGRLKKGDKLLSVSENEIKVNRIWVHNLYKTSQNSPGM